MVRCRLCGKKTILFLNLGKSSLPEELRTKKKLPQPIKYFSIRLCYCSNCYHVQLADIVEPDLIYKKNYFYDYSVTTTGRKHWKDLVLDLIKRYSTSKSDLVIDIGSNTGVLLSFFKKGGRKILGIDPSPALVKIANKKGVPTINHYFDQNIARNIKKRYGLAKIITCTNTFDHIKDLKLFMKGIKVILAKNGIFIIEVPYLFEMIVKLSHIPYLQQNDYFSLTSLEGFFKKYSMHIFDAQKISLHGGSIRIYASVISSRQKTKKLKAFLSEEKKLMKRPGLLFSDFTKRFMRQNQKLISLIEKLKKEGNKIAAVGASAKGITLLNVNGIGNESIDFITEKSPLKLGRFTPSRIPILGDSELIKQRPDYVLLLAWNFKDEVVKNLNEYIKIGGKIIIPLPRLRIIS